MQNVVTTHQGVVHGSVAHEVVAFKGIPKYELSRRATMRFDTPSQQPRFRPTKAGCDLVV